MPERWLSAAKENTKSPFFNDDLDAVQSFGIGSWSCIGKTLGYAELRIILAKLIWHFNVSTAPGGRDVEWLAQKRYTMVEKDPFDVRLRYVGGKQPSSNP